jgi:hypothetical protein
MSVCRGRPLSLSAGLEWSPAKTGDFREGSYWITTLKPTGYGPGFWGNWNGGSAVAIGIGWGVCVEAVRGIVDNNNAHATRRHSIRFNLRLSWELWRSIAWKAGRIWIYRSEAAPSTGTALSPNFLATLLKYRSSVPVYPRMNRETNRKHRIVDFASLRDFQPASLRRRRYFENPSPAKRQIFPVNPRHHAQRRSRFLHFKRHRPVLTLLDEAGMPLPLRQHFNRCTSDRHEGSPLKLEISAKTSAGGRRSEIARAATWFFGNE